MNPIRPTLALAIASALVAGCQAPSVPAPSAPAPGAATTPAAPVTGAATTPAAPAAPVAVPAASAAISGRATAFSKPLANATVRVFALESDAVLAEGRADAQGHFAIDLPQAPTASLLRVVAFDNGTTLATVVAVGPAAGPSARRVLVTLDVLLSEISTTAYAALYPRLRALRSLTRAESTKVVAAFSSLTSVLGAATVAQRQTAIDAVMLRALDDNGWLQNSVEVNRTGLKVLRGIPGFTAAFETAGQTLGEVIGSASAPSLTFGTRTLWGGSSGSGAPAASTADLAVTIDLPGQPAMQLLALSSGVATVRVTLSGPSTAELSREPGATEDPMTFNFTGLPIGTGYSMTCRAESPLGQVLGTTSRVLTLDAQGAIQRDAAGRVLDQANFTLQAGVNAVSVRLPLGGPSVQVTL